MIMSISMIICMSTYNLPGSFAARRKAVAVNTSSYPQEAYNLPENTVIIIWIIIIVGGDDDGHDDDGDDYHEHAEPSNLMTLILNPIRIFEQTTSLGVR